jgi:hypothetical protein
MFSFIPVEGLLGTGAPFAADLNLVVQGAMGAALLVGALFARCKRYRAHAICQTTVLLLNLVMIAAVMWRAMRQQVMPAFPSVLGKWYCAAPSIHAGLGVMAEGFGLYIVLVVAAKVVPQRLGFSNWKIWMRTGLVLWWTAVLSGPATYYVWYIAPQR